MSNVDLSVCQKKILSFTLQTSLECLKGRDAGRYPYGPGHGSTGTGMGDPLGLN